MPYDLAILDQQMPGMDGLELARASKADPALAATPLVLLTSLGQREPAEAAAAGIAATLTKPVRQSELFDAVVRVIGQRRTGAGLVVPPVAGPPPGQPAAEPKWSEDRGPAAGRILVAEDSSINQQVARGMLAKLGYRADVVGNGREALEALARIPYAAVLMDCQMPEMDGFEASAAMRRREGGERHTPIIALTANAMRGDRERCLAAGMDDYVAKPLNADELAAALRRWVPRVEATASSVAPERREAEAASEAQTAPAVLDEAVLANLRKLQLPGQPDILPEYVAMFLRDTPPRLAVLQHAVDEANAAAVEQVAHTLRGEAATLGVREVQALCAELEQLGRAGGSQGAAGGPRPGVRAGKGCAGADERSLSIWPRLVGRFDEVKPSNQLY